MTLQSEILILNTGGTFNKYYEPISGDLKVARDNNFLEDIFRRACVQNIKLDGVLYKDSLEIDDKDRLLLVEEIKKYTHNKIIIVHGTDTMDQSARFVDELIKDRTIVFTGAMKPYSLDTVEAVSNLMIAFGYLQNSTESGVFVSMHGMVMSHQDISKNRALGVFECQI